MITLAVDIPPQLLAWSRDALPREACGLLFGPSPGRVDHAVLCPDAVSSPTSFALPAHALLAHAGDPRWIGIWHSHPHGPPRLSDADARGASRWPRLLQVLVVPPADLRVFQCAADGLGPLPFSVRSPSPQGNEEGAATYVIESPPP